MTLPRLVARAAGIALLGFGISTTQAFATQGEAAPADKAAPTDKVAPADKAGPADKGAAPAAPAATDANAAAEKEAAIDACGKALDKLAEGDAKALDSLNEKRRQALMMRAEAANAVTCLAIAEHDEKFCDLLPKEEKERCPKQVAMLVSLKGASKDEFKARLLSEVCLQGGATADCQIVRDSIVSHDAGKCSGVTKIDARFCQALATSDASKCERITDAATKATCAAYASNDPKRCPKDSNDCRNMAGAFAIVAEKGIAGLGNIDPAAVAAVEGKTACAGAVAALKKNCGLD